MWCYIGQRDREIKMINQRDFTEPLNGNDQLLMVVEVEGEVEEGAII